MERGRTSLENVFNGFTEARESSNPAKAYLKLQKLIAQEAPALITLQLLKPKEAVDLITGLDDKIAAAKGDESTGTPEEIMGRWLRKGVDGEGTENEDRA